MKKILSVLLFIFIPIMSFASFGFIDDYEINVVVGRDNTYDITEKIRYYYGEPTRGFYRTLITKGDDGQTLKISDFKSSAPIAKKQKYADSVKYMIGDPNKKLTGFNEYIISYKYDVGKDVNDNFDAFYFNLLGNEWNDEIKNFRFNIVFDENTVLNKDNIQLFRGKYGSRFSGDITAYLNGNSVFGSAVNLNPHEGITIVVGLEDGYFTLSKNSIKNIIIAKAFLILLPVVFILLLICAVVFYVKHGRDRILTPVVSPYQPNNITPFDVRYLFKKTTDARAISGEIMYLAEKGYISVTYNKRDSVFSKDVIIIRRLKAADDRLTREEKVFFKALFKKGGDTVNVNENNSDVPQSINTVKSILKTVYSTGDKKIYTKESENKSLLIFLLTIFAFLFSLVIWGMVIKTLGVQFIQDVAVYLVFSFATAVLFAPILIVISRKCKKRSEYYSTVLEQLLGLKDYIETVEKEKIEMLSKDDPSIFYKTLSFAIPLECEDKWAKKFKGIALPKNENITGNFDLFDMVVIMHMTRLLNNSVLLHSAMLPHSVPHGGGGGLTGGFPGGIGGGFSGGGFGGGGGGRW